MMELIPRRVITGHGRKPLMIRYILLSTPWFGVYLHHLLRSDYDRAFHDHPWGFVTFLLTGGYTEHTPNGKKFYKAFTFLVRPAQWLHWLEMDTPMWTLIFRGPRERKWGFLVDGKWCWWRQHNYMTNVCEDSIVHTSGSD